MKDIIFPISYKTDTKGIKDSEDALSALGGKLGKIGGVVAGALSAATGAAGVFGGASVMAAVNSEAVAKGLANAVENSQAFGSSATDIQTATDALDSASTKLGQLSGIDDELINQIKTHWLEVPAIAGMGIAGINKAAEVAANVAAGTGKDIESVSNALSKAMENPATAMSKLQKAGVFLTDSQKAVYDQMVANGDEMGANGYLLDQLGEKYKNAAEKSANPFDRLKVIFENLQEKIGGALLPLMDKVVPIVEKFIDNLVASPEFEAFTKVLVDQFGKLLEVAGPLLEPIGNLVLTLLPVFVSLAGLLAGALEKVLPAFQPLLDKLPKLFDAIDPLITPITTLVGEKLLPALVGLFESLVGTITKNPDLTKSWQTGFEKLAADDGPIMGLVRIFDALSGAITNINNAWEKIPKPIRDFITNGDWVLGKGGVLGPLDVNLPNLTPTKRTDPYGGGGGGGGVGGPVPGSANGNNFVTGGLSWVGEHGKELLNIPTGAQVIPLDRMTGGQTVNYNLSITAGMGADGASIGEQIVTFIKSYERTNGRVFASA
jgi:hypothetical protein